MVITDIRQRNGRDAVVLGKLSCEVCVCDIRRAKGNYRGHLGFTKRSDIPGKDSLKPPDVLQSIENTQYMECPRRDDKIQSETPPENDETISKVL